VPLEETIQILADKAFSDDWFNKTYKLNLTRADLVDLLGAATHKQIFQFDGVLYEQTDGVAMGSPLGPLLANVFMYSIEAKLQQDGKLPSFHLRYVDDTLTIMPDRESADCFLRNRNDCHPSIKFRMEVETDASLPFIGVRLINFAPRIETKVYIKPTNSGLLLHYQSHVDNRYKRGLIVTMLDRAYRLSSHWSHFTEECDRLREVFLKLKYPLRLITTAIKQFIVSKMSDDQRLSPTQDNIIRVILPFKDQESANIVKKRFNNLSSKIQTTLRPVFVSRKLNQDLQVREAKPAIVSQQCVSVSV